MKDSFTWPYNPYPKPCQPSVESGTLLSSWLHCGPLHQACTSSRWLAPDTPGSQFTLAPGGPPWFQAQPSTLDPRLSAYPSTRPVSQAPFLSQWFPWMKVPGLSRWQAIASCPKVQAGSQPNPTLVRSPQTQMLDPHQWSPAFNQSPFPNTESRPIYADLE